MRTAARDTELFGVDVPAGSTMLVFFSSANRDVAEFDRPDELRLDRDPPRHHLAFGRGIHFCVGAPLARLEARVVLSELLESTSRIELDPTREPTQVRSLLARRHQSLPLVVR
jgi:cytochrome P450